MKTLGSMVLVVVLVNSVFAMPCLCAMHEAFTASPTDDAHDCCRKKASSDEGAVSSTPAPCSACGIVHRDSSSTCHGTKRHIAVTEQPRRTDTTFIAFETTAIDQPPSPSHAPLAFMDPLINLFPSAFSCVMRC